MIYRTLHIYANEKEALAARNKDKDGFGQNKHICKGSQPVGFGCYNIDLHCSIHAEDVEWLYNIICPRLLRRV